MDARIKGPVAKDETYDVSDPTDWLGTPLAGLMPVEHSLRCHVCKDFYNSPMVTSCCHTFCSLCIRRALATDGKCPLCRAADQESRLRGNWAIRETVEAFTKSRDAILQLARQPPTIAATPAATPKRKAANEMVNDGHASNKRTRLLTRSSAAKAAESVAAMAKEEADILEAEDLEVEETIPDDGLVPCPICTWRMKPDRVDRHLDTNCPGEPRPQPKSSQSKPKGLQVSTTRPIASKSSKAPERLTPLHYSIMTDTLLRKKLSALSIPTWGPRQLLERRHREWVMLWNANCDSARPKTKIELLRDLDTWERTQGGNASTRSHSANLGAQIKDKDFDGARWSAKHSDSFSDLIADARMTRKKAENKAQDASSSDEGQKPVPSAFGGTANEESRKVTTNGGASCGNTPIKSSETVIDLTDAEGEKAPTKSLESKAASLLLGDQPLNSESDTLVSSSLTGLPS